MGTVTCTSLANSRCSSCAAGFFLDTTFLGISENQTIEGAQISSEMDLTMIELGGFYGPGGAADGFNWIFGARLTDIDQEFEIALPELEGELPQGARPDLNVDGVIEIERLVDVLYVGRPAFGQAHSTVGLFRMTEDNYAERITVRLGRASVNTIETSK